VILFFCISLDIADSIDIDLATVILKIYENLQKAKTIAFFPCMMSVFISLEIKRLEEQAAHFIFLFIIFLLVCVL